MKNGKTFTVVATCVFALILACSAPRKIQAQDDKDKKSSYPCMAPVDQYMMADRNAEIALVRTAVPEDSGRDATVWVLGRHGYKTAVEGKNGFVCVVEQAWIAHFR